MAAAGASAYGCTGGTFSLAPDAATASQSGANVTADAGGPEDGGNSTEAGNPEAGNFCSDYTSYTFCESFAEGVPGALVPVPPGDASSGTISADLSSSVSPSTESLEAMLPPVDAGGASARALVGKSFTMTHGTDLGLEAEFNVAKSCLTADGVTVAIITAQLLDVPGVEYSVALTVGATSLDVVEILTGPTGGASTGTTTGSTGGTTLAVHSADVSLTPGAWTNIKLQVHLLKRTFNLTVGTTYVFPIAGTPLTEEPDAGMAEATTESFAVGGSVTDTDASAPACTVLVDNVLFNDTGLGL